MSEEHVCFDSVDCIDKAIQVKSFMG